MSPGKTWVLGHHSRVNHPTKGKKIKSTRRVYSNRPAIHRVLEKVVVDENGCWLVEGIHLNFGYTTMTISKGVTKGSHIVSYEFFVGPVPDGCDIDHVCHNEDKSCPGGSTCKHRRCVNWRHLRAATRSENIGSGRSPSVTSARYAAATHCRRGHELTPENVYSKPKANGGVHRVCKTCHRASVERYNARRAT